MWESDIKLLRQRISELERIVYIPGVWRCPKCNFVLNQMVMSASTGTVSANDEPGTKCPNDGSPMWRVTWKDDAEDMASRLEARMSLKDIKGVFRPTAFQDEGLTEILLEDTAICYVPLTMIEKELGHKIDVYLGYAFTSGLGSGDNRRELVAVRLAAEVLLREVKEIGSDG